ncbi:MAG: S8 family serine peptidase [Lachnospiraceae bacterium]|nr:S8 family serine peptidase [Lachnospiraceae bacterium]
MKKQKMFAAEALLLFLVMLFMGALEKSDDFKKEEVIVAVLDTGYLGNNDRVLEGVTTIGENDSFRDGNGHGTRIIEIILNATDENVKVLPIQVADYSGRSTEDAACQGINYAVKSGVDIIHMSLNKNYMARESELPTAIRQAISAGIEVVVSAGNSGKSVDTVFPANIEEAIVVSAIDKQGNITSYSNYGDTIDFAAYGYYIGESGTSYAAARVTALLAEEYGRGGNVQTLREKAVDAGEIGRDVYYGYGILEIEEELTEEDEKVYYGKTANDLGYGLLDIDWRTLSAEKLNKVFVETHDAYVGMYLSKLDKAELEELKQTALILTSNVLTQNFVYEKEEDKYTEEETCEVSFVENAMKEYRVHEEELTISAEWLILKNYGYFAISSENRNDIYYFQISGFSYRTITPDSQWFAMFKPEKLVVTRTTVKQSTEFGEVRVAELGKYLCSGNCFAWEYEDPVTGEKKCADNLYAIDAEADVGALNYGLSIIIEGYSNEREGYHTGEEDIILIPYDYTHSHEAYSYEEYQLPLRYDFSYYKASTNSTEFAKTPQSVSNQEKNFKKLVMVDQKIWYEGVYKDSYDYSDVDPSLSLEEKLSKYLKSYLTKTISNVNVYSEETSLHEDGFTINADLMASLGIQWNNGETSTIAVQNDIPEYNFPLVLNTYEIVYDGNGATAGGMTATKMEYNQEKNLEENCYSRIGYVFVGWSTTPDGDVEYLDKQKVCNLTLEHGVAVRLYAVWDEFPWILAEDLYFTLEEAQNGEITYERLINSARAEDKEAGGIVLPGMDEEKGTAFILLDYRESDYTELLQENSIPLTYQVIDCVGSMYEKQIMVHIVDTHPQERTIKGMTRFISEKYYFLDFENGGLKADSQWLIDSDYVNVIEQAFENSTNNTPVINLSFSVEEIQKMKDFICQNGVGNSKNPEATQLFYELFLAGDIESEEAILRVREDKLPADNP